MAGVAVVLGVVVLGVVVLEVDRHDGARRRWVQRALHEPVPPPRIVLAGGPRQLTPGRGRVRAERRRHRGDQVVVEHQTLAVRVVRHAHGRALGPVLAPHAMRLVVPEAAGVFVLCLNGHGHSRFPFRAPPARS